MRLRRLVTPAILLLIALNAWYYGVQVRRWAWDSTTDIRFTYDIENGWHWAGRAARVGIVPLYDHLLAKDGDEGNFGLDYLPIRLYIMTRWRQWARARFPHQTTWQNTWQFNAPLLWLNTFAIAATAVAVFFLVRLWRRRWVETGRPATALPLPPGPARPPPKPIPLPAHVGCAAGMFAAILVWFNPALIWETHCWPQWDVWPLPFFAFALLAVSCEGWITAGVLVGVGALTKGQLLLVAPLLAVFPLLLGKVSAAIRVLGGFALGTGVVLWAFLLREPAAWQWLVMYLLAMMCLVPWVRVRQSTWRALLVLTISSAAALGLIVAPWAWRHEGLTALGCAAYLASSALVARRHGWRGLGAAFVTGLGLAIWLAGWQMNGSFSWLLVGWEYGTRHYAVLHMGPTANLAAVLGDRMGWQLNDPACRFSLPAWLPWIGGHYAWPLRILLIRCYTLAFALCIIAAARQFRARSPRFLVAAIAPWLLAYLLLPQMHERYLIWAAGMTAVLAAFSPAYLLIHLALTAVAWALMALPMLASQPQFAPGWLKFIPQITPDVAWALFVIGAILLYQSFAGDHRNRPTKQPAR